MRSSKFDRAARTLRYCVLAAGCAIGLAAATPIANANVVTALWISSSQYSYEIKHMPDFDQRRSPAPGVAGLPGNGSMYCVPTSAINLMAYAANHGFPTLQPGNKAWWFTASPELYNDATNAIAVMGSLMGTSASNGTTGTGNRQGIDIWLLAFSPGKFTVTQQWASGTWSPTAATMAQASIFGGITNIAYGFYDQVGTFAGIPLVERDGGHCITLVKAQQSGGSIQIEVRDPADAPTGSTQSAFVNRQWNGQNLPFIRNDAGGGPFANIRTMTSLTSPTTSGLRLLDSYISIRPKAGYSFTTAQIPPVFNFHIPTQFTAQLIEPEPTPLVGFNTIIKANQSPDLSKFAVIGTNIDGAKHLAIFDPFSKTTQQIDFDPGLENLVFGRNRLLYVATGNRIDCYDIDAQQIQPLPIPWPFPPIGIAYDDLNDELVTIGRFGFNFAVLDSRCPDCPPIPLNLPQDIGLGPVPSVAVSPEDATYWVWSDESPNIYQLEREGNDLMLINTAMVPGCQPTSVQVGDGGFLFLLCDGSVKELRPVEVAGAGIQWQIFEDSIFKDLQNIGMGFGVELSRTNFDPEQHDVPGWNNNIDPDDLEFPPGLPDCPGDLNGDRIVDVLDLAILLNSFGIDHFGDVNGDAVTDINDLSILLNAFGTICPDPV